MSCRPYVYTCVVDYPDIRLHHQNWGYVFFVVLSITAWSRPVLRVADYPDIRLHNQNWGYVFFVVLSITAWSRPVLRVADYPDIRLHNQNWGYVFFVVLSITAFLRPVLRPQGNYHHVWSLWRKQLKGGYYKMNR